MCQQARMGGHSCVKYVARSQVTNAENRDLNCRNLKERAVSRSLFLAENLPRETSDLAEQLVDELATGCMAELVRSTASLAVVG
ncbi:hypothetical protein CSUI_003506 [Cystoisospora suis]|uniref:Uncharacterized protein n=1 Tax=Cystoisospora suis TaxID=483139 RepID=A0A2C6L4V1_9APIC|nr:hypothetical protein CSUI_003506 [Cystoisospora suis]